MPTSNQPDHLALDHALTAYACSPTAANRAAIAAAAQPAPIQSAELSEYAEVIDMLRLALVQAECAIKGREHTGFITRALVASDAFGRTALAAAPPVAQEQASTTHIDALRHYERIEESDGFFNSIAHKALSTIAQEKAQPSDELTDAQWAAWNGINNSIDTAEMNEIYHAVMRAAPPPAPPSPAAELTDAEDRKRLNWIEDQSDFGPIEITLGRGGRPNATATFVTYGADDGSRISSGPARNVRQAIDAARHITAPADGVRGETK